MSLLFRVLLGSCLVVSLWALPLTSTSSAAVKDSLAKLDVNKGVVAVVGLPDGNAEALVKALDGNEVTLWFQSENEADVAAVRAAADKAGLLGVRLFAAQQSPAQIRLADNLADGIVVAPAVKMTDS